jgi:hypothetical protein
MALFQEEETNKLQSFINVVVTFAVLNIKSREEPMPKKVAGI